MPTALQAAGVLRGQLAEAGLRSGRIGLLGLWPTLRAWLRLSVDEIPDDASRLVMLLSQLPVDAGDEAAFAGEAPAAIADRDLVCLELGRDFARHTGPSSTEGIASTGMAVWFADSGAWRALSDEAGWIDLGVTTPNLDWGYPASRVEEFIADLERSRVLRLAFESSPLALETYDSMQEDGTVHLGLV